LPAQALSRPDDRLRRPRPTRWGHDLPSIQLPSRSAGRQRRQLGQDRLQGLRSLDGRLLQPSTMVTQAAKPLACAFAEASASFRVQSRRFAALMGTAHFSISVSTKARKYSASTCFEGVGAQRPCGKEMA
jgi:hypothetical protein